MRGAVYIFENSKAKRVKVGSTINDPRERLRDVNNKWMAIKGTCQICGERRLVKKDGLLPEHYAHDIFCQTGSRNKCLGSKQLPLENDDILATEFLFDNKSRLSQISGTEKSSLTRILNNLDKRIKNRRQVTTPSRWRLRVTFRTEQHENIEFLTHQLLSQHLDKNAPFGEVFSCSLSEATDAVQTALNQSGLLDSVRKEIFNDDTSEIYGTCVICGKYLTKIGSCPSCIEKYLD